MFFKKNFEKSEKQKSVKNSGYSEGGASRSKNALKGFRANSYSPLEDIDVNLDLLRQRSRTLFMTSPIASSAIKYAWCKAEWNGPAQGQLDPVKETAAKIRVEQGFSTREKETTEINGGDFDGNVMQSKMENEKMFQSGLKTEKQ